MRAQLEYRLSFAMLTLGHLVVTFVDYLGIVILFSRFETLGGWTLPEVALLYGLVNTGFAFADMFSTGFDRFGPMLKAGEFDRVLLRPRPVALQLAGVRCDLKRLGRIAQGSLVLAWAAATLELAWDPARVGLLVATIAGGAGLFYGLMVLQATLCFWTTESLEVVNVVTYGGVETAQYPLSIYRGWFRRFFTYVVPLACVNYLPALALLGRPDPLGFPPWAGWVAPLAGPLFLLVALRVFRWGAARHVSTGT